jgi:hypothetical protein
MQQPLSRVAGDIHLARWSGATRWNALEPESKEDEACLLPQSRAWLLDSVAETAPILVLDLKGMS